MINYISIHAPLCGGRPRAKCYAGARAGFQSTPPCAGGDFPRRDTGAFFQISIHAPLCGGRHYHGQEVRTVEIFQSTPPCAGGDAGLRNKTGYPVHFNPRPPVRGATGKENKDVISFVISIHAPLCGGRRNTKCNTKSG